MNKLAPLFALMLPVWANAHTLTLVVHKNDQSLSSGTMVCHSVEHCKYLVKSFEYKNQGNCRLLEVKDGDRVIYRKHYKH